MKLHIRHIVIAVFIFLFFLVFHPISFAQSECALIYGGGTVCPPYLSLSVASMVQKPIRGGEFVRNLTINDPKFSPNQTITFQIILKNTGDVGLDAIQVSDTLPEFVDFVAGNGTYDTSKKTVTIAQDTLSKEQSMVFTITGKIVDGAKLPQDKNVICTTNTVKAVAKNGLTSSSASDFCIEKNNVLGASTQTGAALTTSPASGAALITLLALLPGGLVGLWLRRKCIYH